MPFVSDEQKRVLWKYHPDIARRWTAEEGMARNQKLRQAAVKSKGSFQGKSNALGHGGRAAQLKAKGVPGGVIGMLARRAHAAPGEANYHGKRRGK